MDESRVLSTNQRRRSHIALEETNLPSQKAVEGWIEHAESVLPQDILILTKAVREKMSSPSNRTHLASLLLEAFGNASTVPKLPWLYVKYLHKASNEDANIEAHLMNPLPNQLAIDYRIGKLLLRLPLSLKKIVEYPLIPQSWAVVFKTIDKLVTDNRRRFDKSQKLVDDVVSSMLCWDYRLSFIEVTMKMRTFVQLNVDIIRLHPDLAKKVEGLIKNPWMSTIIQEAREMAMSIIVALAQADERVALIVLHVLLNVTNVKTSADGTVQCNEDWETIGGKLTAEVIRALGLANYFGIGHSLFIDTSFEPRKSSQANLEPILLDPNHPTDRKKKSIQFTPSTVTSPVDRGLPRMSGMSAGSDPQIKLDLINPLEIPSSEKDRLDARSSVAGDPEIEDITAS